MNIRINTPLVRFLAFLIPGMCVAVAGANEEPLPKETDLGAGEPAQVWMWSSSSTSSEQAQLVVRFPDSLFAPHSIEFECELETSSAVGKITVDLEIENSSGDVIFYGLVDIVAGRGLTSSRLIWNAELLPDGLYALRFEAYKQIGFVHASHTLGLLKLTEPTVDAGLSALTARFSALRDHLDSLEDAKIEPGVKVQLQLAEMALDRAVRLDDLKAVYRLVEYGERLTASAAAQWTFKGEAPRLSPMAKVPRLDSVTYRNGGIFVDNTPVFLAGMAGDGGTLEALDMLNSLYMNFVMLEGGGLDHATSSDEMAGRLNPFFAKAKSNNIAVAYCSGPLYPYAAAQKRDATNDIYTKNGLYKANVSGLSVVARYLAKQDMVFSMSVASRPRFMFAGEHARKGFIASLEKAYGDRYALNRRWRTRFVSLEDVPIWWDYNRTAYQFDWQTYHRNLATRAMKSVIATLANEAPGLATYITLDDTYFVPGESRYGIDRSSLAKLYKLSGLVVQGKIRDAVYASGFPNETLQYVLARSFNSSAPIVAAWRPPQITDNEFSGEEIAQYVYSTLWDGAIEGLNAVALSEGFESIDAGDTVVSRLGVLEGFARANLDLNRLSSLVYAFQTAPAELGILLSDSSKIHEGGGVHLEAITRAFEGCSYGGMKIRFVTEEDVVNRNLDELSVLAIAQTPALPDQAFDALQQFIDTDIVVVRSATPIPYDSWGQSRLDLLGFDLDTLIVRNQGAPTEYVHALDEAFALELLAGPPRAVNGYGYTLEGVKTRSVTLDGATYVYIHNIRKEAAKCHLSVGAISGLDMITGQRVVFPATIEPLAPMLVRLDMPETPEPGGDAEEPDSGVQTTPSGEVRAVEGF